MSMEEFDCYKPRTITEELAMKMIRRATDEEFRAAVRATELVTNRAEGKPGDLIVLVEDSKPAKKKPKDR